MAERVPVPRRDLALVDLASVDRALLRLRRIWDVPAGVDHAGKRVEGSTLLVCLVLDDLSAQAGSTEVGVTDVAAALDVAHSTASRLISRAAEAGMVSRGAASRDPRRAALTLTLQGRDLVAASREYRVARLSAALADWPAADVAALADLLSRFADRVRRV